MSQREFGETPYTLQQLTIALNNMDGTFGIPLIWKDGQMYVAEAEHDTDDMQSYGKKSRGLSVPVGSKVSLQGGGLDKAIYAIITGAILTESGTSGNLIKKLRPKAGKNMPHFAVIGEVVSDDDGLIIMGHEAVQCKGIPKITADGTGNKFSNMEVEGYSYPQGDDLEFLNFYEDEADWTAPTDAAAVATFFAAS